MRRYLPAEVAAATPPGVMIAAFVAVDRHHAAKAARKRLEDALPALSQIADAILVLSHPSVRREERKLWATDARRSEASRSGDK